MYHVGKSWPPRAAASLVPPRAADDAQSAQSTQREDKHKEDVLKSLLEDSTNKNFHPFQGLGVVRKDKREDFRLLLSNYTAPAMVAALRDREDTLQYAAHLLALGDDESMKTLRDILIPHEAHFIELRRKRKVHLDLERGFDANAVEMLRKYLARMPRQVTKAHRHRAAVVVPLCNVDGIPSILFEKRSLNLKKHPGEVCFPGGMVSDGEDNTIVSTCLREMEEEVGLSSEDVNVLGILRCNWGEITAITGIAVTPVIGYVGELGSIELTPNEDEVDEAFTVPLIDLLDKDNWIQPDKNQAPVFTGGRHVIWGLTAYILDRFMDDVLARYRISFLDVPHASNSSEWGEQDSEEVDGAVWEPKVKSFDRRHSSFSDFKF
jgi:nudix motif 8